MKSNLLSDPMIDRISRRLDRWKKVFLFLGGRINLIL